jgi:DivIVA domain-containing protein
MATDRARLSPGDSSLSPELVAQRGFITARRGFDPEEVKAFLAQVADQLRKMRQREAGLERALRDAEERAAHPTIDENMLMSAVGEETASILRSAHAAAADIRNKAEDNAARILKEGHDRATAMRDDAETVLGKRTAEAEALATRITEVARAEADRMREVARQGAEALRAQAEAEGKVTIDAAQGARERILNDLTRRRKVAMVQIEQLRAGRERLLEAYKVVRRTLDEVTGELQRADGEARSAAEAAGRRQPPPDGENADTGPLTLGESGHRSGPGKTGVGSTGPSPAVPPLETPTSGPQPGALMADATDSHQHAPSPAAGPADKTEVSGTGGRPPTRVVEERRLTSLRVLRRQKEPKEGTERPAEPPRPSNDVALAGIDTEPPATVDTEPPATVGTEPPATVDTEPAPAGTEAEAGTAPQALTDAADAQGSVDGLFARIRADREQAVTDARQLLADQPGQAAAPTGDPASGSTQERPPGESEALQGPERTPTDDEAILQRRDEAVGTLEASLARKLKRVLQDEQNDMLDRLRGLRTPPTAALVLPPPDAHAVRFAQAGRPLLDKAAKAGALFATSLTGPPVQKAIPDMGEMPDLDDLAAELAAAVVEPLRRRLEQALTDGRDDDQAVLVESLGAAYREWKTQRIEQTAADHVASAFARGAFAATPEDTPLRWLVEDVDGPCPDCDDNALAGGLAKGEPFPTGQRFPPAHAGCRCLLVPEPG